jgi:hypothetical protein
MCVQVRLTMVSGISSVGGLRTTGVFSGKLESARTFYSAVLYRNLLNFGIKYCVLLS